MPRYRIDVELDGAFFDPPPRREMVEHVILKALREQRVLLNRARLSFYDEQFVKVSCFEGPMHP